MSISKTKNIKKLSKLRRSDPLLRKERQKYDFPLAKRGVHRQILGERGVPTSCSDLTVALDILEPRSFFERRLFAMERDGQVVGTGAETTCCRPRLIWSGARCRAIPMAMDSWSPTRRGLTSFSGPNEMREVLHGDRVMVRIAGLDRRGRPEGKIVEVLERANTGWWGAFSWRTGLRWWYRRIDASVQEILLAPGQVGSRSAGQVVVVELVQQPTRYAQPIGKVVEVLGNYADPGMEIEIALRKHELPFEFSKAAREQTRRLPDKVHKMDWKGRKTSRRFRWYDH